MVAVYMFFCEGSARGFAYFCLFLIVRRYSTPFTESEQANEEFGHVPQHR